MQHCGGKKPKEVGYGKHTHAHTHSSLNKYFVAEALLCLHHV